MLEHKAGWEHFVCLLFSVILHCALMRLGANPQSVGLIATCLLLNSPQICVCVFLISFFLQQSFSVLLSVQQTSVQRSTSVEVSENKTSTSVRTTETNAQGAECQA